MRKRLTVLVMALTLIPCMLFAQDNKKGKSYTIVEETVTDSVKIITTTVVEKEVFFTNGFWHNWEFIAGIGPHLYYGENDDKVKDFTEMIAFPAIDFQITKWASPSIGISLGITTARFKGLYQSRDAGTWYVANFKTDDFYTRADPKYDYMELKKQRGWFTQYYALAHLDIRNVIGGYDPDRFYSIDMYAGGGLIVGYDENGNVRSGMFNIGVINKFKITDYVRFMVAVRGALISDDFDGEIYVVEPSMDHRKANVKMDGNFGVTAGLSILLGKKMSKWNPASRTTEILHLGEAVRPDTVMLTDTVVIKEKQVPEFWFHIIFQIDRWDISNKEKVNLHAYADAMKGLPGQRYLICGYADKQTATPAHNLMLSENRAHAVFNFLVNECGVDPATLVIDYKGGVDYMFYDEKELSRCVLITTIKE